MAVWSEQANEEMEKGFAGLPGNNKDRAKLHADISRWANSNVGQNRQSFPDPRFRRENVEVIAEDNTILSVLFGA